MAFSNGFASSGKFLPWKFRVFNRIGRTATVVAENATQEGIANTIALLVYYVHAVIRMQINAAILHVRLLRVKLIFAVQL